MIHKGVNASSAEKSILCSHGVDALNERSCKTSFTRSKLGHLVYRTRQVTVIQKDSIEMFWKLLQWILSKGNSARILLFVIRHSTRNPMYCKGLICWKMRPARTFCRESPSTCRFIRVIIYTTTPGNHFGYADWFWRKILYGNVKRRRQPMSWGNSYDLQTKWELYPKKIILSDDVVWY